jgi:hypothetical protein
MVDFYGVVLLGTFSRGVWRKAIFAREVFLIDLAKKKMVN